MQTTPHRTLDTKHPITGTTVPISDIIAPTTDSLHSTTISVPRISYTRLRRFRLPIPTLVIRTLDIRFARMGILAFRRVMADGGSEMLEVGLIPWRKTARNQDGCGIGAAARTPTRRPRSRKVRPGLTASMEWKPSGPHGFRETRRCDFGLLRPAGGGDGEMDAFSWFGAFRDYATDGLHTRLGWLFLSEDGSGGIWLWMESEGWLGPGFGVWPFLWKDGASDWLYLIEAPEGRTYLYDYSLGVTRSVE